MADTFDFDVAGARQAGFTDEQIADHLAKKTGYDIAGAREAGFADVDIIRHLTPAPVRDEKAPEPEKPKKKATIGDDFERGLLQARSDSQMLGAAVAGARVSDIEAAKGKADRGEYLSPIDRERSRQYDDAKANTRRQFAENVGGAIDYRKKADDLPISAEYKAFKDAAGKGFGAALKAFWDSPGEVVTSILAEGAVASAPSLGANVAGGIVGGPAGALTAGAAVAAGQAYMQSYANKVVELLAKQGVDVNNKDAVIKALSTPEVADKIRNDAALSAIPQAAAGAGGMLVAGKLMAPASLAGRPVAQQAVNIPAQAGAQGLIAMGGEVGSNVVIGEDVEGGKAAAAFIGGASQGPLDVAAFGAGQAINRVRGRKGATETAPTPRPASTEEVGRTVMEAPDTDSAIAAARESINSEQVFEVIAQAREFGGEADQVRADILGLYEAYTRQHGGEVQRDSSGNYFFVRDDEVVALKPWDGQPGEGKISPALAEAQRDVYGRMGLKVVYIDDANTRFDGAVNPAEPDTLFLSTKASRNAAMIGAHEVGHILENTVLPDGTSLGDLLLEQVRSGVTEEGMRHARETFGESEAAPKREAFPAGPEGDTRYAAAELNFLIEELAADIHGEAPKFQTFIPKVIDQVQARYGADAAKDIVQRFLTQLREAMTRLRNLFFKPEEGAEYGQPPTVSQNWLTNIEEVHDTVARIYAERFGTEAEKERTTLRRMQEKARRERMLRDFESPRMEPPPPTMPEGFLQGEPAGQSRGLLDAVPVDQPAAPQPIGPPPPAAYGEAVQKAATYRRWLAELDEQRRADAPESPEAKALQGQIDSILGKVKGNEDRLTNAAADRLDAARTALAEILNPVGDSPDMARVRAALEAEQQRMADAAAIGTQSPGMERAGRNAYGRRGPAPKVKAPPVIRGEAVMPQAAPEAVPTAPVPEVTGRPVEMVRPMAPEAVTPPAADQTQLQREQSAIQAMIERATPPARREPSDPDLQAFDDFRGENRTVQWEPPAEWQPDTESLSQARRIARGWTPEAELRRPQSLVDFVRKNGGIRMGTPEAGDLTASDLNRLPGLLQREGKQVDWMAQAAADAGYRFGEETRYGNGVDVDAFVAALSEDGMGRRKHYPDDHDTESWRQQQAMHAELHNYLEDIGLKPKGMDPRRLAWILQREPEAARTLAMVERVDSLMENSSLELARRLDDDLARAQDELTPEPGAYELGDHRDLPGPTLEEMERYHAEFQGARSADRAGQPAAQEPRPAAEGAPADRPAAPARPEAAGAAEEAPRARPAGGDALERPDPNTLPDAAAEGRAAALAGQPRTLPNSYLSSTHKALQRKWFTAYDIAKAEQADMAGRPRGLTERDIPPGAKLRSIIVGDVELRFPEAKAPAAEPKEIARPLTVRVAGRDYPVASLQEASEKVRAVIDQMGIGSRDYPGATLHRGNEQVGYVAYNGRVFEGRAEDWKVGRPAIYDPYAQQGEALAPSSAPARREAPPDHRMADEVERMLADADKGGATGKLSIPGADLQRAAERVYGGTLAQGAFSRDRLYDAIELGVNRFIQRHPERFSPGVDAETAQRTARDLAALKERLPTQTVRAGEKDAYQQFSTPPDYAYAAAWMANLGKGDHVLEPSAGVGGLIVHAMNAGVRETTANELSDKRRGMIAALEPTRVTGEDAAQLHNILPDSVRPTVVIMNPPFSRAAERMGGKMVLDEGAKHIEQALARLEPGGRLVAIVGDGMKPAGTAAVGSGRQGTGEAFRGWWEKIGREYDVRANVGVDREIYRKYGTSFPTRFLVIDKNPPSGRPLVTGEARDAADLIARLQEVRDERAPIESVASEPGRPQVAEPEGGGSVGELPGATGAVGAGDRSRGSVAPNRAEPADAGRRGADGGSAGRGRSGQGEPLVRGESEPSLRGADAQPRDLAERSDERGGSGADRGGDGVRPDGSGERAEPGVTPAPEEVLKTEEAVSTPDDRGVSEAVYETYRPQRVRVVGAKEHPGALVQSAAMASVMPPKTEYKPSIPAPLVKGGALSDAQLEAITYAGHAHSDVMPDGRRRGFFIGDGTGVGKGREIAGILLDNKRQNRTKAIWVSEKRQLINDAKRDWNGLGQPATEIFDHGKVKPGDNIPANQKGILFTSYDTLRGAEQVKMQPGAEQTGEKPRGRSRVDQIVDWVGKDFDGVIAFDEAHNLGNATDEKGSRGVKKASQKALAGVELQEKLPNARVVYVSATGATEVSNLAYADRLGLWGEGTAFGNRLDFMGKVTSGGMAAMELVARDMKALGHYIARNLSYDGVEYQRLEHKLTPDQRATYDKLAEGWQTVLRNFEKALEVTGATEEGKARRGDRAKGAAMSAFWGAHQRFFNQIITSMQMPSVLRAVEADIKAGRQAVLQLVNTMEAAQGRAIEKARDRGEDLENLDMTPRDQLMQLIEKSFPVQQMEEYADDKGNIRTRPAVDSNGSPVLNKQAVAMRERLLDEIGSIRVPDGPLEILLNHFGTDKVAEVTGRGQRVVRKIDDETGQMKTVVEKRGAQSNVAESNDFQAGKKPILVFSEAGGTGRSYHAAIGSGSEKARRAHYLVQGGWRADKAVQGFGRTHRTNQASAPIFNLVTTDLQGQKRFISSIARRLGQLGALTKGERRTGDQGLFGARDNLESTEARDALRQFYHDVNRGQVEGVTMQTLEEGMGLKMRDPETGALAKDLPDMTTFLNRVLSLKIDDQNLVFDAFSARLDNVIDRAAAAGTLDVGVETYKADRLVKVSDQVVYTDPRSGAETKHVHVSVQNRNHPVSFADTLAGKNKTGGKTPEYFVQNEQSGNVFAVTQGGTKTLDTGAVVDQLRLTSPLDYQYVEADRLKYGSNWKRLSEDEARPLWDQQVAATPEYRKSDLHLITGAVLPIWDRLSGNPKIYRLQTEDGERMLGRVVPQAMIEGTLKRLGAEGVRVNETPAEVAQQVLRGATATLANDWRIKPSRVAGETRLEIIGPDYRHQDELRRNGVFSERIDYKTRFFIPTAPEAAAAAIEGLTKTRPITSLGSDGPQFSPRLPGERPLLDTREASQAELAARQRRTDKELAEANMRGRKVARKPQESAEDMPLFGGERQSDLFSDEPAPPKPKQGALFSPRQDQLDGWLRTAERRGKTDTREALNQVVRSLGDEDLATRDFLRKIASRVGDTPVEFVDAHPMLKEHAYGTFGFITGGALRDGTRGQILIRSSLSPEKAAHAIAHEATHAATAHAILNDPDLYMDLTFMAEDVIEQHGDVARKQYGIRTKDPTEFVAEALSNRDFQQLLETTPAPEWLADRYSDQPRSMWQALVQRIGRLLGLTRPEQINMLDAVLKVADRAMEYEPERLSVASLFDGENVSLANLEAPRFSPRQDRDPAPVFYSAVERALQGAKLEKAAPGQWLGTIKNLPGVKPEEVQWLGLEDWLKSQPKSVTKQEVLDYVRANQIEVREVMKGGAVNVTPEMRDDMARRIYGAEETYRNLPSELRRVVDDAIEKNAAALNPDKPKFGTYALPGGENYRELLLTLPERIKPSEWTAKRGARGAKADIYAVYDEAGRLIQNVTATSEEEAIDRAVNSVERRKDEFRSSHWDEPNVLAHIRFDDRMVGNQKVLHVAEIQSDWHQQGRKRGYRSAGQSAWDVFVGKGYTVREEEGGAWLVYDDRGDPVGEGTSRQAAINEFVSRDQEGDVPGGAAKDGGVPDAPFKTTWPELAMKRVIRFAAENGYDRVTWDTGETNADRFDLARYVSSIFVERRGDEYSLTVEDKGGEMLYDSRIPDKAKDLPNIVGKEMADKIVAEVGDGQKKTYDGLDLKVGGEGMAAFYDKQLPIIANKLGKKFGAKAERSQMEYGDESPWIIDAEDVGADPDAPQEVIVRDRNSMEGVHEPFDSLRAAEEWLDANAPEAVAVHSLEITDAMRRAVVDEGQPLFSPRQRQPIGTQGYNDEQAAAAARVRGVEGRTLADRIAEVRQDFGKKVVRELFDPYVGVKERDPAGYLGLRMANSSTGAVDVFNTYGPLKFEGAAYKTAAENGGPVKLIRDLGAEAMRFMDWVAANRAERLKAEDRENLYSDEDIATLKTLNQGELEQGYTMPNGTVTYSREAAYLDALRRLDNINKNARDLVVQSGLVKGDVVDALWSDPYYVPFYRQADEEGTRRFVGAAPQPGMVGQTAGKRLRGGAQKLNTNLWENAFGNWAHMIDASIRNRAANRVLEQAAEDGIVSRVSAATYDKMPKAEKDTAVWTMVDGQKAYWQVHDDFTLKAVAALDYVRSDGPFMAIGRAAKKLLQTGVAASPIFQIRSLIRDTEQAIAVSPISFNIFKNLADGARQQDMLNGLKNVARAVAGQRLEQPHLQRGTADAIAGGATMRYAAGVDQSFHGAETYLDTPDKIRRFWTYFKRVGEAGTSPMGFGENMNRLALYRQLGEGDAPAPHDLRAYQARDLSDFTLVGASPIIRHLVEVVPYMNAWMQGLYKVGRAAADADKSVAAAVGARVAWQISSRLAVVLAGMVAANLALDAIYADDPDYRNRDEYDRNSNFWFKVGGREYRIPMGFEVAALARLSSVWIESLYAKDMTAARAWKNTLQILGTQMAFNPIPQAVKPLLDVGMNERRTGGAIETMGMERLRPEFRSNPETTLVSRGVSEATNKAVRGVFGQNARAFSPVQLDYLVGAYSGWLGTTALQIADTAVRGVSNEPPKPAKDWLGKVTGGMVTNDRTSERSSGFYVNLLYKQGDAIQEAYATYQDLAKRGRTVDAKAYLDANRDMIVKYPAYSRTIRLEGEINQQIKAISENRDLTAEQKRVKIMRLNAMKTRAAESVFRAVPQ